MVNEFGEDQGRSPDSLDMYQMTLSASLFVFFLGVWSDKPKGRLNRCFELENLDLPC